jgi:hypothetical protein
MTFTEKSMHRIEHWLKHNEVHLHEYEKFAYELELAGEVESALQIRKVASLTGQATRHLDNALRSLVSA